MGSGLGCAAWLCCSNWAGVRVAVVLRIGIGGSEVAGVSLDGLQGQAIHSLTDLLTPTITCLPKPPFPDAYY